MILSCFQFMIQYSLASSFTFVNNRFHSTYIIIFQTGSFVWCKSRFMKYCTYYSLAEGPELFLYCLEVSSVQLHETSSGERWRCWSNYLEQQTYEWCPHANSLWLALKVFTVGLSCLLQEGKVPLVDFSLTRLDSLVDFLVGSPVDSVPPARCNADSTFISINSLVL